MTGKETKMNLIPWKRKNENSSDNGGGLTTIHDFPTVLRRMRNEFDQLFDDFTRNWTTQQTGFGNNWNWGLDIADEEDQISIQAEAPGFEPDDFDVRVAGDRLVIRAAHKTESNKKGHEYREQCECFESLTLPPGVDATKVDANYKNGVLSVTIPKTEEGKGKRIAVKGELTKA